MYTIETQRLLAAILEKLNEQNALLAAMANRQSENTRHASQWKKDNPELSKRCLVAANKSNDLMNQMLTRLVKRIEEMDAEDTWDDSEGFQLTEFLDTYGQRFPQFAMIIQNLAQLGS